MWFLSFYKTINNINIALSNSFQKRYKFTHFFTLDNILVWKVTISVSFKENSFSKHFLATTFNKFEQKTTHSSYDEHFQNGRLTWLPPCPWQANIPALWPASCIMVSTHWWVSTFLIWGSRKQVSNENFCTAKCF